LFALRGEYYRPTLSSRTFLVQPFDARRYVIHMNLSRRRLIFTGAAGVAVLVAARWLQPSRPERATAGLTTDAADVVRAIAAAMLDGALPEDAADRRAALDDTVDAVGTAIAGLPPLAREELATLFALLGFAPLRIAFAKVDVAWRDADVTTTNAFLVRLQTSRWSVKRIAYDALHQLTFAAWYANPRTWPSIGYPGPPALT
jgi:hypothetical protein